MRGYGEVMENPYYHESTSYLFYIHCPGYFWGLGLVEQPWVNARPVLICQRSPTSKEAAGKGIGVLELDGEQNPTRM